MVGILIGGLLMDLKILDFDEEAKEADVLIRIKSGEFICYAYSFKSINELKVEKIVCSALLAKEIMLVEDNKYRLKKLSDYYSYYFQGKLVAKNMVKIDDIYIEITDYIPKDIQLGEYISFKCERVDLLFQNEIEIPEK